MKRHSDLWKEIITPENISLAFDKARKGKSKYSEVRKIERKRDHYLKEIQSMLENQTFQTSDYKIKKVYEPKERDIYVLPFYPDRIIQHCLMNVIEPIWDKLFIHDSYACRKGKGQHKASQRLMYFIRKSKYKFYLQGDIKKFYPSIKHDIMKNIVRNKIKDKSLLHIFDNIIDSIKGNYNVPIGNYTSQWLGNLYLNELDTFVKHELKCKYYLRYNDDFVILGEDIKNLKIKQEKIRVFLKKKLDLTLAKDKIQPVKNGIEFIGYKHFIDKILIRKSSKIRMFRKLKNNVTNKYKLTEQYIQSYLGSLKGWLKWSSDKKFKTKLKLKLQEL